MRALIFFLLFVAVPSLAEAPGERRTAPEPSDVALFVVAVIAVWLTRRALRRRAAKD